MTFRRPLLLLILLVATLPFIGLSCRNSVTMTPVKLTYWRVFDDPLALQDIITAYRQIHPNITIEVQNVRYEDFERQLVEALAEDRGPDLFTVHNTWIGKYESKILPLPATITQTYQSLQGTIKKEIVTERRTTPTLSPAAIRKNFVDVVPRDVIRSVQDPKDSKARRDQIFGLPLAVDTMALYYNEDILNAAGIATVPQTWEEFLAAVQKITRFDDKGNIIVGGAAIGTANNIPRFADLLMVLMAQNGAKLTDANNYPTFHITPPAFTNKTYNPGLEAIRFYTDFANSKKQAYTWNDQMPDAFEAFTQGKVAFFFGYSYHMPQLKERAPQLRWGVAPLPQTDPEHLRVNVANYWVETVSKKTKFPNEAWDFIQFATAAEHANSYLAKVNKPTALRSLISSQTEDPLLEPFANQLLTAQSWYRGRDVATAETALADMLRTVATIDQDPTVQRPDRDLLSVISVVVSRIIETIKP